MITRDAICAANAAGTLVNTIAEAPHGESDALANRVSDMHNSGEIDFLAICNSDQLDAVSGHRFFHFQCVFCQTLPQICCPAEAAMLAANSVFEKAGADLTACLAYDSLRDWFERSPGRAEEGLTVLRRDPVGHSGSVRSLLVAGAAQDARKFGEVALDLCDQGQPDIRSDALWALGRVVPEDDDRLLSRALDRFSEAVDAPRSDRDSAAAVEAALHLFHRIGRDVAAVVQSVLARACGNPTATLRQSLARSVLAYQATFTEPMIDTTLSALETADKEEIHTVQAIDSLLYVWDLDGDRERMLRFLAKLLSGRDNAIELEDLDSFRNRIRNEKGEVLGWYVVSFLLTGDDRLCLTANRLLPYKASCDGLDIGLGPFALESSWILFLSRKILGYCLFNKESAAALLLSCLRAAPEQTLPELETLILDHFLMNFLTAIDWFETAVAEEDPARESISRLSQQVKSYIHALRRTGTCPAFRPTERERQLQGYRQADFWRDVQKSAEESSLLSVIAHKATILYGTASIAYVYVGDDVEPKRQEISMATREHVAEFPRLEAMDPVGLRYAMHRFRSELPPS